MKWTDKLTCNHCRQSGQVQFTRAGELFKVRDEINHLESCPAFVKRTAKHFRQKGWERQERSANDLVGASETIASGARDKDGDGRRLFEWRVESKQTGANIYRLYVNTWKELLHKCRIAGENPLLHVQVKKRKFCVVSKAWYPRETFEQTINLGRKSLGIREDTICPFLVTTEDVEFVILTEHQFKELKDVQR